MAMQVDEVEVIEPWQERLRADNREGARELVRLLDLTKGRDGLAVAAKDLGISQKEGKEKKGAPQLRKEVLDRLHSKAAALLQEGAAEPATTRGRADQPAEEGSSRAHQPAADDGRDGADAAPNEVEVIEWLRPQANPEPRCSVPTGT